MIKVLDEKAISLLRELEKDYNIQFKEHSLPYCEVYQNDKNVTISYNKNLLNNASIVHELLHVWLDRFGFSICGHIYSMCSSHKKLKKIMTKHLCNFINNFFEHQKIYPKFIEMGYSPQDFVNNGLAAKCSITEIKFTKMKFFNLYFANSVNKFIGTLISIYADQAPNNYDKHLSILKSKDSLLFEITTDYWKDWLNYDITNIDPLNNSFRPKTNKFIERLEEWTENKRFL